MPEPDLQAFKKRIKLVIEEGAEIFEKDSDKSKAGKLRKVLVGLPDNNDLKNESMTPYLSITNADRTNDDTIRSQMESGGKISNSDQIVRFDLWLVDQKEEGKSVEETVDNLWKLLKERLKTFATLDSPISPGNPLCDFIELSSTQRIPQTKGQELDGFRVLMECILKTTL